MSEEVNAVLASSGDFYRFRSFGVNVYQGKLYRCDGKKVDTCWICGNGDLFFTKAGEIKNETQAETIIEENDISFTVCFGPVMVENGVNVVPPEYFIGNPDQSLPRSCLGQVDELHYLLFGMLCVYSSYSFCGRQLRKRHLSPEMPYCGQYEQ